MKTRLAVLLSLLLSFAGAIYVDALDIRVVLDDLDQKEASAVDDLDDLLFSQRSASKRNHQAGRKLPTRSPRDFYGRLAESTFRGEINVLAWSSNRKLYGLHEVFRI